MEHNQQHMGRRWIQAGFGMLLCSLSLFGAIDRHPELKSRAVAWTEYDGSYLVDTYSRAEMADFYKNVFAAPFPDFIWTGSLATQNPGEISEKYRVREYSQASAYRALNYTPAMEEDPSKLSMVQAAAMVLALNDKLTHIFDPSFIGYSELAALGARSSSLCGTAFPHPFPHSGMVDEFIIDGGLNNKHRVGHRALILNGAAQKGAIGAAIYKVYPPPYPTQSGYGVLWQSRLPPYTAPVEDIIAWPAPGYMPIPLINGYYNEYPFRWSFQIATDIITGDGLKNAVLTAKLNGNPIPLDDFYNDFGIQLTWGFPREFFNMEGNRIKDGDEIEITVSGVKGTAGLLDADGYIVKDRDLPSEYKYKVIFFNPDVTKVVGYSPRTPLTNLSTRGTIGTGDNQLIAGLSVTGKGPVRVALRTQGPGLEKYGVSNAAKSTRLKLYDQAGNLLGENAGWKAHPNKILLENLGLAPSDDKEAAIVATLWPGLYTAVVSDDTQSNGIGIVEAFNIDNLSDTKLVNLATRGNVGKDDRALMAGFVVKDKPRTILVRTQGPSLSKYGVAGVVGDTLLSIVRMSDGGMVASNDDWKVGSENARLSTDLAVYAPGDSREAALLVTLQPGAYSAVVSSKLAPGVGIVEVFDIQ